VGLTQGESISSTIIDMVEAGTPAAAAGVLPGDRIVSVAGASTRSWEDVRTQILTHPGQSVPVVVERAGSSVDLVAEIQKRTDGTGYLGVQPAVEHRDLGALGALGYAGKTTVSMGSLIFKGIGMMFTGQVPVTGSQGLAGPVGIIQLSSEAVQGGYYLMLLALISINLAILNMLPLLPLDGGHVLFSIIERIRGRSLSLRVFERISMVGFALFLLLFIVATSNDIGRVFGG
jgi:regulator of sigma E protease